MARLQKLCQRQLLVAEGFQDLFQFFQAGDKHLSWLGAFLRSYYSCGFKLVHHSAGLGIAHSKSSLKIGCGASLIQDNHPGSFFEPLVKVLHVHHPSGSFLGGFFHVWQVIRSAVALLITLLVADELGEPVDLVAVNECALDALHFDSGIVEHVSPSDQFLGARGVEDG